MAPSTTKITLSDKELSMVKNADWILTKQVIIQKVYELFAGCIPSIRSSLMNEELVLPDTVKLSVPKIYKGENYLQLPYVMLDYPRCFNGAHTFAVRTMFWWANFFSITLHLSGDHKTALEENLLKNKDLLNNDFYIGVSEDQWEHHFREDNYLLYRQVPDEQRRKLFEQNNFIKLALKFNLDQWNDMEDLLKEGYKRIVSVIA